MKQKQSASFGAKSLALLLAGGILVLACGIFYRSVGRSALDYTLSDESGDPDKLEGFTLRAASWLVSADIWVDMTLNGQTVTSKAALEPAEHSVLATSGAQYVATCVAIAEGGRKSINAAAEVSSQYIASAGEIVTAYTSQADSLVLMGEYTLPDGSTFSLRLAKAIVDTPREVTAWVTEDGQKGNDWTLSDAYSAEDWEYLFPDFASLIQAGYTIMGGDYYICLTEDTLNYPSGVYRVVESAPDNPAPDAVIADDLPVVSNSVERGKLRCFYWPGVVGCRTLACAATEDGMAVFYTTNNTVFVDLVDADGKLLQTTDLRHYPLEGTEEIRILPQQNGTDLILEITDSDPVREANTIYTYFAVRATANRITFCDWWSQRGEALDAAAINEAGTDTLRLSGNYDTVDFLNGWQTQYPDGFKIEVYEAGKVVPVYTGTLTNGAAGNIVNAMSGLNNIRDLPNEWDEFPTWSDEEGTEG